jgi:hypothetical protein
MSNTNMSEEIPENQFPKVAPLPEGVVTDYEILSSPEEELQGLIDRFEQGWASIGGGPRDQRKFGDCNSVPDILAGIAADEHERNGLQAEVKLFQLENLHTAAGGFGLEAFRHGFNTINISDQSFLVDLTFGQFLGTSGNLEAGPKMGGKFADMKRLSSGAPNDTPFVQEIIAKGYVPLTDDNLREYVRITSMAKDKSYSENVTTELLDIVRPLEPNPFYLNEYGGSSFGLAPIAD